MECMENNSYDSLYEKWNHLAGAFPAMGCSLQEPLLEELIAETSVIGRYEPRLIEIMAGWIQENGDLINTVLMSKFIPSGDSSVIGLLTDLLDSKEALKFKNLQKYCVPKEQPEMLYHEANSSPTLKAKAVETETEINRKWNLYYVSLRIKTNAIYNRQWVLKNNPNLARRALFGAEMRTEILNYLLSRERSFTAEIARTFGYRQHRVAEEIDRMIKEGIVKEYPSGRKKEIAMQPEFGKYLGLIPF